MRESIRGLVPAATTRLAVVATAVLLVSAGVGAGSAFTAESRPSPAAPGDATATSPSDDSSAVVHPELRNASGTRVAVVRFSGTDRALTAASSSEGRVASLKRSAARAQREAVQFARESSHASVRRQLWLANALVLEVDAGSGVLDRLASFDAVERVHPNVRVASRSAGGGSVPVRTGQGVVRTASSATTAPNATDESESIDSTDGSAPNATDESESIDATYGLELIDAPDVWTDLGVRGNGTTVAVLDTGVDPDHPDVDLFRSNRSDPTYPGGWAEFDTYGDRVEDSRPRDVDGHGTHVAGIATGGNASGQYVGVAPDARLIVAKALNDRGRGSFARIVASMEWAVQRDADVISTSLGVRRLQAGLIEPVRNAEASGSHVVAASGRYGPGTSEAPANVHEAIAVGAIDRGGRVDDDSSGEVVDVDEKWGSAAPDDWPDSYTVPDVVAPGVGVRSAARGGGYARKNGTSMATPHVAGTVALMESATTDLSPSAAENALEATSWRPANASPGEGSRYGAGIVDARDAVALAGSAGLEGAVTSDGVPVPNARVETSTGVHARTREDGTYRLPLPAGDYTLHVDGFGVRNATREVTVSGNEVANASVSVDPAAAVRIADAPARVVESGATADVTVDVANAETLTPLLNGSGAENATIVADGRTYERGTPVQTDDSTGNRTFELRVDENATGALAFGVAVDGPGGGTSARTESITVVDSVVEVGVLAQTEGRALPVALTLDGRLPVRYRLHVVPTDRAAERVDSLDVVVAQRLGDARTARTVVEANREDDVGLVLLEQYGSQSDAITRVANVTDWLEGTEQRDRGAPPVEYRLEDRQHPVLGDLSVSAGNATIHTGRNAGHAWLSGLSSGTVLARVGDQGATSGPGLAVDDGRNVVFAASLGRTEFVRNGHHAAASNRLLANSVEFVARNDRTVEASGNGTASRPRATLSLGNATIVEDEAANVTLATDAGGVAGYQARLRFDPAVLDVVDVRGGDFAAESVNVDGDDGSVDVAQADAAATDAPELATIEFEAAGDAGARSGLELVPGETLLNDASGDAIPTRLRGGTATVLACQPSDANGDGRVTSGDATLIQRRVVGLPVNATVYRQCADVTDDGELTSGDVTRVLRTVVGLEGDATAARS